MAALRWISYAGLSGAALAIHSAPHNNDEAADMSADPYRDYRRSFGHRDDADVVPYHSRRALYEVRVQRIADHNSRSDVGWTEVVNEFADSTPDELNSLLGYRRVGPRWFSGSSDGGDVGATFMELNGEETFADAVDVFIQPFVNQSTTMLSQNWGSKAPKSILYHRNQGACGSCWAVAAAGAIEMHAELNYGDAARISHTELVNCVQNPKHCGGTGGCSGATAELAYEWAAKNGVAAEGDASFQSQHSSQCKKPTSDAVVKVQGYKTLEVNKLQPLLSTLMHKGPAAVSVDGGRWSFYHSGVFHGCEPDTVVNHAVLMVGFGYDKLSDRKYWLIRNSWGDRWGEKGFIRIERHSADTGKAGYCGWDNKPKDGVFCDGAPAKVPVCGMCGILSDSSYPTGVTMTNTTLAAMVNTKGREISH